MNMFGVEYGAVTEETSDALVSVVHYLYTKTFSPLHLPIKVTSPEVFGLTDSSQVSESGTK